MHYPSELDVSGLREAVSKTLMNYDSEKTPLPISRGQWILENPRGEIVIEQVKNYAKEYFAAMDGLVIPGGGDIPSLLYEEFTINRVYFAEKNELLRSVIEFALLDLSEKNRIPAMGICRGCQIMNVFLNGTLEDCLDLTGPLQLDGAIHDVIAGYQEGDPRKSFLDKITHEEALYALSLHGQSVEMLGETVTPLLWVEAVMKFALAKECNAPH